MMVIVAVSSPTQVTSVSDTSTTCNIKAFRIYLMSVHTVQICCGRGILPAPPHSFTDEFACPNID